MTPEQMQEELRQVAGEIEHIKSQISPLEDHAARMERAFDCASALIRTHEKAILMQHKTVQRLFDEVCGPTKDDLLFLDLCKRTAERFSAVRKERDNYANIKAVGIPKLVKLVAELREQMLPDPPPPTDGPLEPVKPPKDPMRVVREIQLVLAQLS